MNREEIVEAIKEKSLLVWYDEKYCIEAVKQDADAIQYVNLKTFGISIKEITRLK